MLYFWFLNGIDLLKDFIIYQNEVPGVNNEKILLPVQTQNWENASSKI